MIKSLGQRNLFTTRARETAPHVQRIIKFAANPQPELNWMFSLLSKTRAAIEKTRYGDVENILSGFADLDVLHYAAKHQYYEFFEVIAGGTVQKNPAQFAPDSQSLANLSEQFACRLS